MIFFIVLLIIGIIFFVMFNCMNYSGSGQEHFETKSKSDKKDTEKKKDDDTDSHDDPQGDLSPTEKELFEDLKNNKLNNEQISDLVSGGVLTEKLVEKFLAQLNITPDESPAEHTSSTMNKKKESKRLPDPKEDAEEEFVVEGFTGNTFASARF
jgi:hypothetical protein